MIIKKNAIIGYGAEIRGDDALGILVIHSMEKNYLKYADYFEGYNSMDLLNIFCTTCF